jgi:hypothetical protein
MDRDAALTEGKGIRRTTLHPSCGNDIEREANRDGPGGGSTGAMLWSTEGCDLEMVPHQRVLLIFWINPGICFI